MSSDPIDDAIAATDPQRLVPIECRRFQGTLSSGRPFWIELPTDATDIEVSDAAAWTLTVVRASMATHREGQASSPLWRPGSQS